MKRLSDSRTPDSLRHRLGGGGGGGDDDDPDSPLYASPTAYGYAKIGAYSRRDGTPATPPLPLHQNQVQCCGSGSDPDSIWSVDPDPGERKVEKIRNLKKTYSEIVKI